MLLLANIGPLMRVLSSGELRKCLAVCIWVVLKRSISVSRLVMLMTDVCSGKYQTTWATPEKMSREARAVPPRAVATCVIAFRNVALDMIAL